MVNWSQLPTAERERNERAEPAAVSRTEWPLKRPQTGFQWKHGGPRDEPPASEPLFLICNFGVICLRLFMSVIQWFIADSESSRKQIHDLSQSTLTFGINWITAYYLEESTHLSHVILGQLLMIDNNWPTNHTPLCLVSRWAWGSSNLKPRVFMLVIVILYLHYIMSSIFSISQLQRPKSWFFN